MYCCDVCVGMCTGFRGCLSHTGWCPFELCKHYLDLVLPPANGTQDRVQLRFPSHLVTLKLESPRQHITTYCCTKTKNTKFRNVIMLFCLFKGGAQPSSYVRGGEGLYSYPCLFVVLSCLKLF